MLHSIFAASCFYKFVAHLGLVYTFRFRHTFGLLSQKFRLIFTLINSNQLELGKSLVSINLTEFQSKTLREIKVCATFWLVLCRYMLDYFTP